MARKLARAGGIAKGIAQGQAGFLDIKKVFEDAKRKHQWQKERDKETAIEKRQQAAFTAGYQPQDMGKWLAGGNVPMTAPETTSYGGEGGNIPKQRGDLELKWIRFTKMGNRMIAVPTYGRSFEVNASILENMIGSPEDYGLNTQDMNDLRGWIKQQTLGGIRNRPAPGGAGAEDKWWLQ